MKKIPRYTNSPQNCGLLELEISSLSDKGEGIAHHDGMELYVQGTLPGDFVAVRALPAFVQGSKRHPVELFKILRKSAMHAEPQDICPHHGSCGGCPLGAMSYPSQLEFKHELICEALGAGGIAGIEPSEVVPSPRRMARFKSIRYFAQVDDQVVAGFYQSRSHTLCPVTVCPLEQPWFGKLSGKIAGLASELKISAYDETARTGQLRALVMRDCGAGGRLAVLSHAGSLPEAFVKSLRELFCTFKIRAGFLQCNQQEGNRILAGKMIRLTEDDHVEADLGGLRFEAGPNTFLQVNYAVAQKLYAAAVSWCGSDPHARALDLCCGSGTMTLMLSARFKQVVGVEIVEEAVAAARGNAARNRISNVEFIAADLKRVIGDLVKAGDGLPVRAVIADPARVGLGEASCLALGRLKGPVRLALIFCGLKALSRDLPMLIRCGYAIKGVRGFDMFPGAIGVETLVCLEKGS